ncbi:MAG: DUF1186 domain-containing protein [Mesonia sp.]|uniref:DUF1186 domain-containing protein n=1 Tax=Mesonia sp. TaxID=1960830 RepID=UPI003F985B61
MEDSRYEQRNYKITNDPEILNKQNFVTPFIQEIIEDIHPDVEKGRKYMIQKLQKLIAKYPQVPIFKNFLTVVYKQRGEMEKAIQLNQRLHKEHPDYFFGKINLAAEYLTSQEYDKIPEVLGEEMELQDLYPNRDTFHSAEFISFYQISGLYYLYTGDLEQAEIRLEMMQEIDEDNPKVRDLEWRIEDYKTELELEQDIDYEIPPEPYKTGADRHSHLQTLEAPKFNFPLQMQWLYEEDYDFPENKLQKILALEREPLIKDLQKVLNDSILRFDHFLNDPENEEFTMFPIHAIFIICELKATKAIPTVLEVLQQDEEIYETWFGDFINDIVNSIVFTFGEEHYKQFFEFLKLPNLYTFSKSYVSEGLIYLLKEKPALRQAFLSDYKHILDFFIEKQEDDDYTNELTYGLIISDVVSAGFKELLPEITKLYKLNLVAEDVCGDLEEIEKNIQETELNYLKTEFHKSNIFEKYQLWKVLEKEFEGIDLEEEEEDFLDDDDFDDDDDDVSFDEEAFQRLILNNQDSEPAIKPKEPRRNDPCPCGNGKKYKKCCMNA